MRYYRAADARDQRSAPTATDWRDQAACRSEDTNVFFDETQAGIEKAKAVCAACPIRTDCLEYALAQPERYGVWGGMSADERKKERHNRWRRASGQPRPKLTKKPKKKPRKPARGTTVDATGTMRRLQALAARGIGSPTVEAHVAHGSHGYLGKIRAGERQQIDARVAVAVAEAYRHLSTMPPGPYGGQAIALARDNGWLGPEAWVGLDIDDPASGPAPVGASARVQSSSPMVPAVGCARRLQAAAAVGIPVSAVASMTGLSVSFLAKVRAGRVRSVRVADAGAVRDALLRIPAPEAAVAASVGQATVHGWLPLEAWEGVDIDDPDAQPRQTAAA